MSFRDKREHGTPAEKRDWAEQRAPILVNADMGTGPAIAKPIHKSEGVCTWHCANRLSECGIIAEYLCAVDLVATIGVVERTTPVRIQLPGYVVSKLSGREFNGDRLAWLRWRKRRWWRSRWGW